MNTLNANNYLASGGRGIHFRVKKKHALYLLASTIVALILGAIAGYRPFGLGLDFPNYDFFYYGIRDDAFYQASRFEPGFKSLAYFAKHALNWDVMPFMAMLMMVTLIVKFQVLGRLEHPWTAIFFYVLVWFPLHENTQVRVAVAVTFLFMATKPLFDGRWIRYLLVSSLSILFHYTAIFAIAMIAGAYYLSRFPRIVWITAPIVAGALMYIMLSVLFPYFALFRAALLDGTGESTPPNLLSVANLFSYLFLVATFFSGSLKSREAKTYFILVALSFATLVGFQSIPVLANRLREILFVFMTFIAFEYKLTLRTFPQAILAASLALWSLYRGIQYGLFSG